MEKIRGRFYFKKTSNNNLIGEFSNNVGNGVYTESADLIFQSHNNGFIGKYNSTWHEDGQPFLTELEISPKNGTNNSIFELKWTGDNSHFKGEGMLCDEILIGNYWSLD